MKVKIDINELHNLRKFVWGEDIASSTVPEYVEHHESIQKILKAIDTLINRAEDVCTKGAHNGD